MASGDFCAHCRRSFRRVQPPGCPHCGEPFEEGSVNHLCPSCEGEKRPVFATGQSIARFEGALLEGIHRWKYQGDEGVGERLISWMIREMEGDPVSQKIREGIDLILSIPLSPQKQRKRGFNQATLLAKGISRHWKIPLSLLSLRRHGGDRSQVGLSREERASNVRGVFHLSPAGKREIAGKRVLLVDDVLTTGTTLREAGRTLRRDGSKTISFITLARTP